MPISESAITPALLESLKLLIRANHILHQNGLVDAFGHISIRHPRSPSHYIISAYDPGAPALVSSHKDLIVYNVSDSTPAHANQPQGYSERFIHGEIFKRVEEAQCVVHSHSEAVIPFTISDGVKVRPIFHMAGFMGADGLKVFDPTNTYEELQKGFPSAYGKTYTADMLIKTQTLGAALAAEFVDGPPVVLQRKHGFTCWGSSIEQAIYRAIYTQKNCELLQNAIALNDGSASQVGYLTDEEAADCAVMNEKCEDKAWRLWVREVQVNPLYKTEEGEPADLAVRGMRQ